jgi:hypothetical protein
MNKTRTVRKVADSPRRSIQVIVAGETRKAGERFLWCAENDTCATREILRG